MEAKYTIVITDKDLFECQKKAGQTVEASVEYQKLPAELQDLVRNNLREYSKLLQGIMWKQRHVAFTDGNVLATLIENYTEAVPEPVVKEAAIKMLARCPASDAPLYHKEEAPRSFVPKEKAAASFKENFIKTFGRAPKPLTV